MATLSGTTREALAGRRVDSIVDGMLVSAGPVPGRGWTVTGIPREGLIGTDFSDYFTEPDKAEEGYLRAFERGSVTDYPLIMRHQDGALAEVLYNAAVHRDSSGKVLGLFAAARDVTEQKLAQAELEKQAKELDQLAELERF